MRLRLLCVLILAFVPALAFGQSPCTSPTPQTIPPTFTCQAGIARSAQFDYNGLTTGVVFRLLVNGAQVGADVPATTGTVQVQFGATLPAGSYTVVVQAVAGSSIVPSAPITLVITPTVTAPSNLKIVEVIMRGLDLAGNELWRQTVQTVTLP